MSQPITQEDWDQIREEGRQELPEAMADVRTLPEVLLGYQQKLLATTAIEQLVICEKSRRIGMTWAVGADAVLSAASARGQGGQDVLYIGFNLDMAREFIDVCAMWARAFVSAASDVGETIFDDTDENGDRVAIKAFRITFASGFEIMALTSRPRSLRGRQGYVIFDEAAFHDELGEMLKAAMALLMWGGKLLVISTHDGVENPFNELIQDVRAGKRKGQVLRVDFDEAMADGLYERIALVTGKPDTAEAKTEWRDGIFSYYGSDADEELRCIPKSGSGTYLSRAAIEACMTEANVVRRLVCPPGFELRPMAERTAFVKKWLEDVLPFLDRLDPNRRTCIGEDFGRSIDLSVVAIGQELEDLSVDVPLMIEMENCPIAQQRQ
ncbi:MAG: terminase family protein, partial [Pseudomonadota bacterium]